MHLINQRFSVEKKFKLRISNLLVLIILFLSQVNPPSVYSYDLSKYESIPHEELEKMHVVSYTKDFANRFSLPILDKKDEPKGGAYAVEFYIERINTPIYQRIFKVYLPNSMIIDFPEQSKSGNKNYFIQNNHFFAKKVKRDITKMWNKNDRIFFLSRKNKYNMKIFMASKGYGPGKKGSYDSMSYLEYHNEIVPEIAYLKIYDSTAGVKPIEENRGFEIWIKKIGDKEKTAKTTQNRNEFYKFELPNSFYSAMRKISLSVEKINKQNRKQIWKKK